MQKSHQVRIALRWAPKQIYSLYVFVLLGDRWFLFFIKPMYNHATFKNLHWYYLPNSQCIFQLSTCLFGFSHQSKQHTGTNKHSFECSAFALNYKLLDRVKLFQGRNVFFSYPLYLLKNLYIQDLPTNMGFFSKITWSTGASRRIFVRMQIFFCFIIQMANSMSL